MSLRGRLLSQSTLIFAARIFGAGLTFLVQVAIARLWGSQTLGDYMLIIATVNIVSVVLPLGFEATGTYFAAEYRARGEGRLLRGFMARAYLHIGLCGAVLFFFGYPLTALFGEAGAVLGAHWLPACLLAVATAVIFVSGAVLVGLKRPFAGFFPDTLFRPMLAILGFAIAVLATGTVAEGFSQLIWALAIGYCLTAAVHLWVVLTTTAQIPLETTPRANEWKRWWRFAMPWMVLVVVGDFFFDIDLLLLASTLSREDLAIFGVCTRVFSLAAFGVASVYAITLPDMFESNAKRDSAGFSRKVGDANLVAVGLAVVLFAIMIVGGPLLLTLFGPSFLAGAAPLAVLSLALVVRSALGPAAVVLSMHDRPFASLPAIGLGVGALVAANLALVPTFGLMGAATAALIAISVWSAGLWFTALKTCGVDVSIMARLRRDPAGTEDRESALAAE